MGEVVKGLLHSSCLARDDVNLPLKVINVDRQKGFMGWKNIVERRSESKFFFVGYSKVFLFSELKLWQSCAKLKFKNLTTL